MRRLPHVFAAMLFLASLVPSAAAVDAAPKLHLDVKEFTLKNGMLFLVVERPATPQVAVRLAIRAGSALEERGRTGIAHLLEHMMFKGTKNFGSTDYRKDAELQQRIDAAYGVVKTEQARRTPDAALIREKLAEMDRLRQEAQALYIPQVFSSQLGKNGAVGVNAFTSQDQTQYIASVPSDMLEQWLSIASEQLFEPSWREFYVERDVVQREWDFRYVNNPEGAAWLDLNATRLHRPPVPQPRDRLEIRHGTLQHPGRHGVPRPVLHPDQRRLRPGRRRDGRRSAATGRNLLRALPGGAARARDRDGRTAAARAPPQHAFPRRGPHAGGAHRVPRRPHDEPRFLRPGRALHGAEPGAQRPADSTHRQPGARGRGLGEQPRLALWRAGGPGGIAERARGAARRESPRGRGPGRLRGRVRGAGTAAAGRGGDPQDRAGRARGARPPEEAQPARVHRPAAQERQRCRHAGDPRGPGGVALPQRLSPQHGGGDARGHSTRGAALPHRREPDHGLRDPGRGGGAAARALRRGALHHRQRGHGARAQQARGPQQPLGLSDPGRLEAPLVLRTPPEADRLPGCRAHRGRRHPGLLPARPRAAAHRHDDLPQGRLGRPQGVRGRADRPARLDAGARGHRRPHARRARRAPGRQRHPAERRHRARGNRHPAVHAFPRLGERPGRAQGGPHPAAVRRQDRGRDQGPADGRPAAGGRGRLRCRHAREHDPAFQGPPVRPRPAGGARHPAGDHARGAAALPARLRRALQHGGRAGGRHRTGTRPARAWSGFSGICPPAARPSGSSPRRARPRRAWR